MTKMFCYQCEQAMGGKACIRGGICGKSAEVSNKQDELTCALIGLARASRGKTPPESTDELVMQALFATLTNVNFDAARIDEYKGQVQTAKQQLGGSPDFNMADLWTGDPDEVSMRSTLLFGLRGMAAYAWHAWVLGKKDK